MDTRTLRYFLVTAQERNFTKAANKLCMAQPPLSRQIKLLEEELGVTLFIRNSRQLQLTEEGYFLKQQAEEILLLIEKTEHQLEKMGNNDYGTISIGATESCGGSILPHLIEGFHEAAPHIRFQIWTGNSDEINSWFNEIASERNIFCLYNSITSVMGFAEHNLGVIICPESAKNLINRETLTYRKIIDPVHESGTYLVKKHLQLMATATEKFWKYVEHQTKSNPSKYKESMR